MTINESTGVPVINESISHIKSAVEGGDGCDRSELKEKLEILNGELCKVRMKISHRYVESHHITLMFLLLQSVAHRVLASNKLKANEYLIELIKREVGTNEDDSVNQKFQCS